MKLAVLLVGAGVAAACAAYFAPKSVVRIYGAPTMVCLYRVKSQNTVTLPVEEYLIGAVAARMQAGYPLEALRAQAVAARSLTDYHLVPQGLSTMPEGADISDDPGEGQPWLSIREMRSRWGWAFPYYLLKVADAVWTTRGEILTYGSHPVDAVTFGDAGGRGTENASDIWGVDVPYLRRVVSVEGKRPADTASYTFGLPVLSQMFSTRLTPDSVVRVLSRTASGRPLTVEMGTDFLTARFLAGRLNLPSSYFDLEPAGDHLIVVTTGSGDGVGMSREGAAVMATQGDSWQDIVRHYYTGVEITRVAGL